MSQFQSSLQDATRLFQNLSYLEEPLHCATEIVRKCLLGGNKLLTCGNGGSASDSAHFATEFLCRFQNDRPPFPAICLASEGGLLTAIGNDYQFEDIFARQVQGLGLPGDVVITFSTSGKSKNVLRALEEAKKKKIQSIAFLGKDGGFTKGIATVDILVNHQVAARIQEAHKFLIHVLCENLEKDLGAK